MRKFLLVLTLLALAIVPCTAYADVAEPFKDFGLHLGQTNYTNGSVYFREGDTPYYGEVKTYNVSDYEYFLGGTLKAGYKGRAPFGTLTILSGDTPIQRELTPGSDSRIISCDGDTFVRYDLDLYYLYYSMSRSRSQDVLWNLYTSPDANVTVGSATVPPYSSLALKPKSKDLAADEIVPYFKEILSSDNKTIEAIELSFVKSGDFETPVTDSITEVRVSVNYLCTRKTEYDPDNFYKSKEYYSYTFSGKDNIITSADLPEAEDGVSYSISSVENATVYYRLGEGAYRWDFQKADYASEIEWGELALDKQPLTLLAGQDPQEITIKLPSSFMEIEESGDKWLLPIEQRIYHYDEETGEETEEIIPYREVEENYFVSTKNSSVLTLDEGSFNYKKGSADLSTWNGLDYQDYKATVSFKLLAQEPGLTMLILNLPVGNGTQTFYREVNVVDSKLNLPETGKDYLKPTLNTHISRALIAAGKPYYPSAKFEGLELGIDASAYTANPGSYINANANNGFITFRKGNHGESYRFYWNAHVNDSGTEFESSLWDNVLSYGGDNPGYSYYLFRYEDINNYSYWWESNVHITSIDAEGEPMELNEIHNSTLLKIPALNFKTTAQQLESFVPYFESQYDEDGNVIALAWSFVNSKTMAKVTPTITNLTINDRKFTGTSGTLTSKDFDTTDDEGNVIGNDWQPNDVSFSYEADGVTYRWDFSRDYSWWYSNSTIYVGEATGFWFGSDSEPIVVIQSTDIISQDSIEYDDDDYYNSYRVIVKGLKAGTSAMAIIAKNEYNLDWGYLIRNYFVTVKEASEPIEEDYTEIYPSNFYLDSWISEGYASIIEGKTYYDEDDSENDAKIEVTLRRLYRVSSTAYEKYKDLFKGKLSLYSNDKFVQSFDIEPSDEHGLYEAYEGSNIIYYFYVSYLLTEQLGLGSDIDVNGLTFKWEFPLSGDKVINRNGEGTISPYSDSKKTLKEQFATYKPYIKLNRDGLNVKSFEWYFVDSADNRIATPTSIGDNVVFYLPYLPREDEEDYYRSELKVSKDQSVVNINLPERAVDGIQLEFTDNNVGYSWWFSLANSSSAFKWNATDNAYPLVMTVGDAKTITITHDYDGSRKLTPYVGNSDVVNMEVLSTSATSITVKLTAKAAGMTSIRLSAGADSYTSSPREIWVADSSGNVPHLTKNIEDFMEKLTLEEVKQDDKSEDTKPEDNTKTEDTDDGKKTGNEEKVNQGGDEKQPVSDNTDDNKETVINNNTGGGGETVIPQDNVTPESKPFEKPDFALTDERKETIREALKEIFAEILNFIDEATEVFFMTDEAGIGNTRSVSDVKDEEVPSDEQLAAPLPATEITKPAVYVFKVDVSMLKVGAPLFWHACPRDSVAAAADNEDDTAVFYNADMSQRITTVPADKNVVVAAYMGAGSYAPIIATSSTKTNTLGSSGSGCNAGLSLASLLLGLFLIKRKSA